MTFPLFADLEELATNAKADACAHGWHGQTRHGDPVDHGDCVNVDEICVDCGQAISVTSWTKEAWGVN